MELRDGGENRGSSGGLQIKGIKREWRTESKAVRQGRSRQSRLAWMGDGGGSAEVNGVGMCSSMKGIIEFLENTPSHVSIPEKHLTIKDGELVTAPRPPMP